MGGRSVGRGILRIEDTRHWDTLQRATASFAFSHPLRDPFLHRARRSEFAAPLGAE